MSANSQIRHFWQLAENDLGNYQAPANYYVSRNIGDHFAPHHASAFTCPSSFDYIADPYLWDIHAAATNYNIGYYNYYYQPTSGYVDDHVYVATDDQFPFMIMMSSNMQSRHLPQLAQHHLGYHQAPANYHYVSRNIGDHYFAQQYWHDNHSAFTGPRHTYNGQSSFDYIEDPYLWDVGYNQPTSEFIDVDHYFSPHILDHNSAFTSPGHTYNGQSSFDHIEDPCLWDDGYNRGEFIDGVFVTTESEPIDDTNNTTENESTDDVSDTTESESIDDTNNTTENESTNDVFDTTESESTYDTNNTAENVSTNDVSDITESEFTDDDYDTTESEFIDIDDVIDLLLYFRANMEGDEEEATKEIIANLIKTRIHCGTDDEGEMCVICQCEYENDETIGALECKHEFHAGCIEQWVLRGKKTCPICRSSVLPSQEHSL
ncbi:E3 ubiquitin ligase BIG BROTHER-related-like [Lycium barbarum]|uniref:E3 ubiquitin ligase BIG BROTHER-related-like n=1 Tax=Lycium barbarum TaxID=112863 RepID=UPI00293F70C4|nr:E3 ubiquitin ligase BIG BROTHER-related-like [Lycium barbarum]